MGKKLCIDEVNLCGQVYTILSNVEKRNGIVSILPWTKSQPIIERLNSEISKDLLEGVKEVASDMWPSMELILKEKKIGIGCKKLDFVLWKQSQNLKI